MHDYNDELFNIFSMGNIEEERHSISMYFIYFLSILFFSPISPIDPIILLEAPPTTASTRAQDIIEMNQCKKLMQSKSTLSFDVLRK